MVVFTVNGATDQDAHSVDIRVAAVAIIPAIDLQQAGQNDVGQNLDAVGSLRADRVTWLDIGIAGGGLAVFGAEKWFIRGSQTDLVVTHAVSERDPYLVNYLRILVQGYPAKVPPTCSNPDLMARDVPEPASPPPFSVLVRANAHPTGASTSSG